MTDVDSQIDYARFGQLFFEQAVTEARIRSAFARLQAQPIEFGPRSVGPGGLASVTGRGHLKDVVINRSSDSPVRFALELPVTMHVSVRTAGMSYEYEATLHIPLSVTAEAHAPLTLVLAIEAPAASDIEVQLVPKKRGSTWFARMVNMEEQIRHQAARQVGREIASERVQKLTHIDIAERLERSWGSDG